MAIKDIDNARFEYIVNDKNEGTICSISYVKGDTVTIPDCIDGIPIKGLAYSFPQYKNVKHIILSDGISSLPEGFLQNNQYIRSVRWPSSCTIIPEGCFRSCYELREVKNLKNVKAIGAFAFASSGVSSFDLSDTEIENVGENAFAGSFIRSISWPSKCTYIPKHCFSDSKLKEINNISNIECIKKGAFDSCYLIGELDLNSAKIKDIESFAFNCCSYLESVIWPSDCESIPPSCFYSTRLSNISNIEHVEFIGAKALASSAIKTLDLSSNKVEEVGLGAFEGCYDLEEIIWSENCETIPPLCFSHCSKLSSIKNTKSVKYIQNFAFERSGFSSLNFQEDFPNLEFIGRSSFAESVALESVVWPDIPQPVNDNIFFRCSSLSDITNLNTATEIGKFAFAYTKISNIDLSSSLMKKIDRTSFNGCELNTFIPPYYVSCPLETT